MPGLFLPAGSGWRCLPAVFPLSLRVAAYFDSHKRRHYFQRRVHGGPQQTRQGCFHPCFLFSLPVSSLAPMPHRSGWSCSLRRTSGCSSLGRMLTRPSLRLLLPLLLLLQVLRSLCRPTDEGTTLFSLAAPPPAVRRERRKLRLCLKPLLSGG